MGHGGNLMWLGRSLCHQGGGVKAEEGWAKEGGAGFALFKESAWLLARRLVLVEVFKQKSEC